MARPSIRVGILGATGSVGQKLVTLLDRHPWFELAAVAASPRSAGRSYGEAVHWLEPEPLSEQVAAMVVKPAEPPLPCDLVFSALDSATALEVEPAFAAAGIPVVSNASAARMDPAVPLVVPEVNGDHLAQLEHGRLGRGFIVTNPNCATVGLVLALKPLVDAFGVDTVRVTTLQAVSGAGYPGIAALDILGNAVPHIAGEEEKLQAEPAKILGRLEGSRVIPSGIVISAQVTRVPVLDGHLLSLSVKLSRPAALEEVRAAFAGFGNPLAGLGLPSAPQTPLRLLAEGPFPQPRLHANLDRGMTVTVGRLRPCPVADVALVGLVHNTIRGAAGAALLNAEMLLERGLLHRG